MNEDIDVVIPWLNPTDKWFSQYKKYCENENPCRIRDLNTIRPTIKSILKNLPWIRYIWLIVFDEEQYSNLDWEELKNEKIKFVHHRDIIPQEFLPNFNSIITEAFIHNIDGIADYFIFSDDDMIYNRYVPKEHYIFNKKPVHKKKSLYNHKDISFCMYSYIINSTSNFIKIITGNKMMCDNFHMPSLHETSLLKFLWYKYENYIIETFKDSKIRKKKNISMIMTMYTLEEIYNICVYEKTQIKTSPIWLNDGTKKEDLIKLKNENDIVCLNDSEELSDKYSKIIADYIKDLF